MHYYQFSIGDYRAATAHLSNEEDLAYRRLLDMYYDTENKIPLDTQWVAKRLRLATEVVDDVLKDMFVKHEDGWFHARCDDVIQQYHAMAEKNRANGRLGGRKKNPVGNQMEPHSEPIAKATNNHKPETINQEPKKKATGVACPPDVSEAVWLDWLQLRKAKKAPVTQTVVNSAIKEAEKAGVSLNAFLTIWCARGSQGLQAEWLKTNERQPFANKYDVAHVTTPPPPNQDAALRKIEEDRKRAVPPSLETLAKLAELRKGVTQ